MTTATAPAPPRAASAKPTAPREGSTLRNTLAGKAAFATNVLVMFVLTPYLLVHLGPALYGLQVLSQQAMQICAFGAGALTVAFVRQAAVHHARGESERRDAVLGAGLGLAIVATALLALIVTTLAVWAGPIFDLAPELVRPTRWLLVLFGIGMGAQTLLAAWESPTFLAKRLDLDARARALAVAGSALATVIVFETFGPSLVAWVALTVGLGITTRVLLVVPGCRRALPELHVRPRLPVREEMRTVLGFGALAFLGSLGHLLYYATDSILITKIPELGSDRVTAYNLGARWDPLIRTLLLALIIPLVPVLTEAHARGDEKRFQDLLLRGTRWALLVAAFPCIVLTVHADTFLRLWVGPTFVAESTPVLRWILGTLVVSVPAMVGYQALVARGRIRGVVWMTLLCGLVNIALSVFFAHTLGWGLVGIALGTVTTMVARNLLFTPWVVLRETGLSGGDYARGGLQRATGVIALLLAVTCLLRVFWTPHDLVELLLQLSILAGVWLAAAWSIGLVPDERELARARFSRTRPSRRPPSGPRP